MIKTLTSLIFIFFLCEKSFCQIRWDSVSIINCKNFKATSPKKSEFTALSSSQIVTEYTCNPNCLSYNVEALFIENESWMIDSSNYLLQHEILHFHIEEIFARQIRKYLRESYVKQFSKESIEIKIKQLLSECSQYQILYDRETYNSLNIKQQWKWSIKIRSQLKQLKDYSQVSYNYCKDKIKEEFDHSINN